MTAPTKGSLYNACRASGDDRIVPVRSMEDLAKLCASMDIDNNGRLSLEEMQAAYDEVEEFAKLMQVMDMKKEDMETVFRVMADISTEEVSYLDLCQSISSFFKRDPIIMQSLVKFSIQEVRKILREEVLVALEGHTEMLRALLPPGTAQHLSLDGSSALKPNSYYKASWGRASHEDTGSQAAREAVDAACLASLAGIDSELQTLLAKAEAIANSVLGPASMQEKSSRAAAVAGVPVEAAAARPTRLPEELCSSFQERELEADRLRKRCHQIVSRLSFQCQHEQATDTEGAGAVMYTVERF